MQISNHIKLTISGRARALSLRGVLLKGSVPMRVRSPLPVSLEGGVLRVQAKPGESWVRIRSRFVGPRLQLGLVGARYGPEVWAFQPQTHLRVVQIQGVPAIDPGHTTLPSGWKHLSVYRVKPGAVMRLKVIRRGNAKPAPDQLQLQRKLWLDFDGHGLTIQDTIRGSMRRHWSLVVNRGLAPGRITVDGKERLITRQRKSGKVGVELRKGRLRLTALSRYEGSLGSLPAVGWDHDFHSLSALLYLPPRVQTVGGSRRGSSTGLLDPALEFVGSFPGVVTGILRVQALWGEVGFGGDPGDGVDLPGAERASSGLVGPSGCDRFVAGFA